jgi:Zn-dependent membrane protease YugP
MDPLVVGLIHYVHVLLGVFWFGTILYTRLVLFPAIATLPPDQYEAVRRAMVSGNARRWTYTFGFGSVIFGILRGAVTGVFAQLDTAYGLTYLAALLLGVFMLFINFGPIKHPLFPRLFVGSFPVMFTLMVLMRFGL